MSQEDWQAPNKVLPEDIHEKLDRYLRKYQQALRDQLLSLPRETQEKILRQNRRASLATGNTEVWICQDGVVALILNKMPSNESEGEINISYPGISDKPVLDFLHERKQSLTTFHDPISKAIYTSESAYKPHEISIGLYEEEVWFSIYVLIQSESNSFVPPVSKILVMDWNAIRAAETSEILSSVEAAKGSMRIALTSTNLGTRNDAYALLEEFEKLLNEASKEEKLQVFLRDHPEFLYPAQVKCYPKFPLGSEKGTDYVLLVQASHGSEYVFVEIERANKKIFRKDGQFHADFTQARNQLLDWEAWITHHHAYVRDKLPNLHKPKFHLVMGRGANLTQELRNKIQINFSGSDTQFSTYDDLASRYKQIVDNLLQF